MKKLLYLGLLFILSINLGIIISKNLYSYTRPFYPQVYQEYKKLYGQSQYVRTKAPTVIPDEFVYAYASWEYMRGLNPLLLQGETPPLGKYFIGITATYLNNERIVAPIFNVLSLIALFVLAKVVLESTVWALGTVTLFSFEKLFIVQMLYAPLLDNIQLFFILLSFIFYTLYLKKGNHLIAAYLCLGAVMSVKFWSTGVLILCVWIGHSLIIKNINRTVKLLLYSPVLLVTMLISFIPSFVQGDNLRRFFGVQKYLYEFHKSKLDINLTSVWDLLLFNRWHVPWEGTIKSSVDWQWTWPFITLLSLLSIIVILKSRKKLSYLKSPLGLTIIWVVCYIAFLSLSNVLARYILPILPFMYILAAWFLQNNLLRIVKRANIFKRTLS